MRMMSIKATYEARIPDTQDKSGRVKHALDQTHKHALEQLEWLVKHLNQEWKLLKQFPTTEKKLTQVEKLIHATKKTHLQNIRNMTSSMVIRHLISAGLS